MKLPFADARSILPDAPGREERSRTRVGRISLVRRGNKQTIFSIPEVDLRYGQILSLLDRLEGRRQRLQFRPGDPRNN